MGTIIKRLFTIEALLFFVFIYFAHTAYNDGNMLEYYGNLIIAWILLVTNRILNEIRRLGDKLDE